MPNKHLALTAGNWDDLNDFLSVSLNSDGTPRGVSQSTLTSPTYGNATSFGNVTGSFGGPGTGNPTDIYAPIVIYEKYGVRGGSAVTKTTQAAFVWGVYAAQTADDSAEAMNASVILGDDPASSFTQTLSTTGFEGSAQARGSVHATGTFVGTAGRLIASETSTIDVGSSVYATYTKAAGATITVYKAFHQAAAGPAAAGSNFLLWGFDDIFTSGIVTCGGFTGNPSLYGDEPLAAALGLKTWNFDLGFVTTNTAPTAGTVYAVAVPYRKGQVVTHIDWDVNVPGSGTVPTHIYAGICDASGVMLAQSADAAASAVWTTAHVAEVDLTGSYTIPTSGLYYHVFLQVGSWSVTQMTLNRGAGPHATVTGLLYQAAGGTLLQTGLPANTGSIVGGLVSTNGLRYWSAGR